MKEFKICPITFIGDTNNSDISLNQIHASSYYRNRISNYYINSFDDKNNDFPKIHNLQIYTTFRSIVEYCISNASSIYYASKIDLLHKIFDFPVLPNKEEITFNMVTDGMDLNNIYNIIDANVNNTDIYCIIMEIICTRIFQIIVNYYQQMVYDIIQRCYNTPGNDDLDNLFNKLYLLAYNEEMPKDNKSDFNTRYTFCNSILNEMIENELNTISVSLQEIRNNSIQMFLYSGISNLVLEDHNNEISEKSI